MTHEQAVALSLTDGLSRIGLTERLRIHDPVLLELAASAMHQVPGELARAATRGIRAISWNAPQYPVDLLTTSDCAPALWYRGRLDVLSAPVVAIVGARAASAAALELAAGMAAGLAARGVTVVSGLARGIDSAAHRGALSRGRTVAVLGSGLNRIYPREHLPLAEAIAATGLLLSEYPPDAAPLPFRFPLRNRIISGLARAVVVIEASEKSGSLITAGCALEQGREVMVVPGDVLTGRNRGGHALLRDGAALVESADDVLMALGLGAPAVGPAGDSTADPILREMIVGQPYDLDGLAAVAGLSPARLLQRISELELDGSVRRAAGGRFIRSA